MSVNIRTDIMALPSRTGGEVDRFLSEKGYDVHKEILYPLDRIIICQVFASFIAAVGVAAFATFGVAYSNGALDIARTYLIIGSACSAVGIISSIAFAAMHYHKRKVAREKVLSDSEVDHILQYTHERVMRQAKYNWSIRDAYGRRGDQLEQAAKDLGIAANHIPS